MNLRATLRVRRDGKRLPLRANAALRVRDHADPCARWARIRCRVRRWMFSCCAGSEMLCGCRSPARAGCAQRTRSADIGSLGRLGPPVAAREKAQRHRRGSGGFREQIDRVRSQPRSRRCRHSWSAQSPEHRHARASTRTRRQDRCRRRIEVHDREGRGPPICARPSETLSQEVTVKPWVSMARARRSRTAVVPTIRRSDRRDVQLRRLESL